MEINTCMACRAKMGCGCCLLAFLGGGGTISPQHGRFWDARSNDCGVAALTAQHAAWAAQISTNMLTQNTSSCSRARGLDSISSTSIFFTRTFCREKGTLLVCRHLYLPTCACCFVGESGCLAYACFFCSTIYGCSYHSADNREQRNLYYNIL